MWAFPGAPYGIRVDSSGRARLPRLEVVRRARLAPAPTGVGWGALGCCPPSGRRLTPSSIHADWFALGAPSVAAGRRRGADGSSLSSTSAGGPLLFRLDGAAYSLLSPLGPSATRVSGSVLPFPPAALVTVVLPPGSESFSSPQFLVASLLARCCLATVVSIPGCMASTSR